MPQQATGQFMLLIGSEATKAMSPDLWNPVLRMIGSLWQYRGWDVPVHADMAEVRSRLLQDDVVAANVTMPHKHWAAGAAETASPAVQLSGAANLLIRRGDKLEAHNTDVTAVKAALGGRNERHVLMMGAGGAARAALVAVHGKADFMTFSDRDPLAAWELLSVAQELGIEAQTLPWHLAQEQAGQASLIVNATPLGKNSQDGPVWGDSALAPDALVYDFVYAAHTTGSIAHAKRQNIRCIDGWEHLFHQAAAMVPLLGLPEETGSILAGRLEHLQVQPASPARLE